MNRQRQHLRLKQKRNRRAKLQKLRDQYRQATNTSTKDSIKQKIVKLAPHLNTDEYLG